MRCKFNAHGFVNARGYAEVPEVAGVISARIVLFAAAECFGETAVLAPGFEVVARGVAYLARI